MSATLPIVERLRNDAVCQNHSTGADPLCVEAADRITELYEALEHIRELLVAYGPRYVVKAARLAEAALAKAKSA